MNRTVNRALLIVLWLSVTAGTAFLVARNADDGADGAGIAAPAPPRADQPRAVTALAEATIAPVVSGDGSVARDEEGRWLLVAPAWPADLAYRLLDPPVGVRALIDGGPAGFDCAWAGLAPANGAVVASSLALPSEQAGVSMRCVIPDDVRVVEGMTGTMVLMLEEPVTALALPLTAVNGSAGSGQVIVVRGDGETEVRTVELGRADSYRVEITAGLEPGEQVLEAPVQSDFAGAGS